MKEYLLGVLAVTGINLLAVLGVSMLTGFTGYFTFGHGAFMSIGAYASGCVTKYFGLPMWMGMICGTASAAASGVVIGYPTLRLRGDYFCIATLGLGEAVRLIVENAHSVTGGARGLPGIPMMRNGWIVIVILDVVCVALLHNFLTSKYGRSCVALREDETAAAASGVNPTRSRVLALCVSAGLAGLGGSLMAHFVGYLHPSMFGLMKSTDLVVTVILGGVGSLTGSILATLVLIPLPELLRAAAEWRMAAYGLAVIVIMLLRPSGLLGYRELTWAALSRLWKSVTRRSKGALTT